MISTTSKQGYTVYPTLNIYMSPRVQQHKVQNHANPLVKYTRPVTSNLKDINNKAFPPREYLENLSPVDGMIYSFKEKELKEGGMGRIKMLICICMYNEGGNAINLTLTGIYNNLKALESEGIAADEIAVVLVQDGILKLVSDRKKRKYAQGSNSMIEFYKKLDQHEGKTSCALEERIHTILDSVHDLERNGRGAEVTYNRDFPPNIEKNVSLLYQNLWEPSITSPSTKDKDRSDKHKLRVFTAFKHSNGTKLSSHLLFFEGFCRYIKPEFCVLLDVGTKPDKKGLMHLIRGFYSGKNIGGCTGLMSIDAKFQSLEGGAEQQVDVSELIAIQNGGSPRKLTKKEEKEKKKRSKDPDHHNICWNACMSIEKAQEYEYIMAHFLDKNAESATGFLHVLPGAWSAYRYEALIKTEKYEPNLLEKSYFKIILDPDYEQKSMDEANMYLAEDRILSLGIYCQINSQFTLKYVPEAIAYTDPMKDHKNLMAQRRRWINSSLFAFLYVFRNYYYHVQDSSHNCCRKYITLNVSMFLALLSFVNSYFTPAIYWFLLYVSIYQLELEGDYSEIIKGVAVVVSFLYVMVFLAVVGGSLAGKVFMDKAKYASYFLTFFVLLMYILVFVNLAVIYLDIQDEGFGFDNFDTFTAIILIGINVFCFIFVILMHLCTHPKFVCRLLIDQISYIMYIGAYSQTMVIYGFCNVDDVSWGTKGASGHDGKPKHYESKVNFVSTWYAFFYHQLRLFWNVLMAFIFLYLDIVVPQRGDSDGGKVLLGLVIYSTSIILFKTILAIYNHFKWLLTEKCCSKIKVHSTRREKMKSYFEKRDRQYREEYDKVLKR